MNLVEPVRSAPGDDGGLEMRQTFRAVKDRMARRRAGAAGINCVENMRSGQKCGRPFRTWSALRSHLITYHGIDHRVVPE